MKKDALILALITLVAGLLLGGVYELTADARAKQEQIAKNKAYMAVFENNKSFKDKDVDKFTFVDVDLSSLFKLDEVLAQKQLSDKVVIDSLVKALDKDGKIAGYVFNVTSKNSYSSNGISFSVGLDYKGNVTGISILSIEETPGLGMKAKEDSFLNQYVDKFDYIRGKFVVNKDNPGEDDIKVDAISGATITSRAMTDGVNAAVAAYVCISVDIHEVPIDNFTTGGASNE